MELIGVSECEFVVLPRKTKKKEVYEILISGLQKERIRKSVLLKFENKYLIMCKGSLQ